MAYTPPVMTDWDTDDLITSALVKTYILDNLNYLNSAVSSQIIITAAGMWPDITAGCAAINQIEIGSAPINLKVLDFDASSIEYAQCTIPAMPSDWDGGTLTARFIWTANDNTTNAVVWTVGLVSLADGEAIDSAWGSAKTVTDQNGGAAYTIRKSDSTAAITAGGISPAGGELLQIYVGRAATDGADTLATDARLIGVIFTYTRT